ncbi:MAG: protein-tyrosine phosphatase family protein [Terriglobales bacterium]
MNPKLYYVDSKPPGKLAISARPRGEDWLEDDIDGWRRSGIDAVVSLLTQQEAETLGLKNEKAECAARGIRYLSFSIDDRGVPSSSAATDKLAAEISELLRKGLNVAIHCRQGIGRSSMIAAAVLVLNGIDLSEALDRISAVRDMSVPETREQRHWLDQFSKRIGTSGALMRTQAE